MSYRLFSRLLRNGKGLLKYYNQRRIHSNILQNTKKPGATGESLPKAENLVRSVARNQNVSRFGFNARRLFIDNILSRVTNPLSSEIRADVTKKYWFGDSAPFFALVGVSLASGNGMLTKDDELEGVCMEIRQAVAHYQSKLEKIHDDIVKEELKLDNLEIGPPISKGCNAVVYAASLKNQLHPSSPIPIPENVELNNFVDQNLRLLPDRYEGSSRYNIGGSVDDLNNFASFSPSASSLRNVYNRHQVDLLGPSSSRVVRFSEIPEVFSSNRSNLSSVSTIEDVRNELLVEQDAEDSSFYKFPLAVKMMFNYDVQSNAMSILKAMHKETIPARKRATDDAENWEKVLLEKSISLPAHPNIVTMYSAFCDQIPNLKFSSTLYPMALPPRINPSGYGRNMSLFLLMKRYNFTLNEFLSNKEIPMRTRILLFAQLLEAVAHLSRYGIPHRDLKSDNLLIETSPDSVPVLVISDFGCCLADKDYGLKIPYNTDQITKGGNAALMAPEIILKEPGTFSVLNYTKSDLWACGAIAYEIFGKPNPFYQGNLQEVINQPAVLRNFDYQETDLPDLGEGVPQVIKRLVENMLQRSPGKRLNPDIAANVVQLYLWAPSNWIKDNCNPTSNEILQWLLSLTTKVLCEGGTFKPDLSSKNRRTFTEYQLLSSFLARAKLRSLRSALNWIQSI